VLCFPNNFKNQTWDRVSAMFRSLLIIACLLCFSSAFGAELFVDENLVTNISDEQILPDQSAVVFGRFEITREFSGHTGSMKSEGNFLVHKTLGLSWQQSSPFDSKLVLTEGKMTQSINGATPTVMLVKDNPMPFTILEIFQGIFQNGLDPLSSNFNIYLQREDAAWTLGLSPSNPMIKKAIATITVEGNTEIEQLTIRDIRGNVQNVRFSTITHTQTLTKEQQSMLRL